MRHHAHLEEDLALLAGGDLASSADEQALRAHLAGCAGCRELFEALAGDLEALSSLAVEPVAEQADSLADSVLRGLTHAERPAPRRAPRSATLRAAAAAVVAVVALSAALSLQGPYGPAEEGTGGPSAVVTHFGAEQPDPTLPIRVRRSGDGVELEWTGDGREQAVAGPATPYRVTASASPSDFGGGRMVEVAGSRLVATGVPFPTRRLGDRDLTYFRVE